MAKRMREKAAKIQANKDMRPHATARYVRISPSKVRIVLDIIRGKGYMDAMAILQGTPKAASEILIKLLASAGANAENNLNMSKTDLYVAEAYANEGPTLKRWWPRSHGSADTILKRTSHITIVLDERGKTAISKPAKSKNVVAEPAEAKPAEPKKQTAKSTTAKAKAPAKKTTTKTTKAQSAKGGEK